MFKKSTTLIQSFLKCYGCYLAPVNGHWGRWSRWSDCISRKIRTRNCDNPKPKHEGKYCFGDFLQIRRCWKKYGNFCLWYVFDYRVSRVFCLHDEHNVCFNDNSSRQETLRIRMFCDLQEFQTNIKPFLLLRSYLSLCINSHYLVFFSDNLILTWKFGEAVVENNGNLTNNSRYEVSFQVMAFFFNDTFW